MYDVRHERKVFGRIKNYVVSFMYNFKTNLSAFYVLLTAHLVTVLVNNQLDSQFLFMYVYFYSLHVSGSHMPIIRRTNCIKMTSGICHSV
jgi:hypothetical protein